MNKKNSPPRKVVENIRQEMTSPSFPYKNICLMPNATTLEISKYDLCQKILAYKQDNKLTTEKVAQQINLTVPETEDILFARINKFTLDRLVAYATNLFPFHLAVHEDQPTKQIKKTRKATFA